MTTLLSVMDQIKEDIEDNFTVAKGYTHQPVEVKRGMYKYGDFPTKPVICFTMFRDTPDEDDNEWVRWINVYFYAYADTDGAGGTDTIYELYNDFSEFLESSNFTYYKQIILGEAEIKEGGISDPINAFTLEARIAYEIQ